MPSVTRRKPKAISPPPELPLDRFINRIRINRIIQPPPWSVWVFQARIGLPPADILLAAALPLIAQLETAPQALDDWPGWPTGGPARGSTEQALSLIGLVRQHPSSHRETKDRVVALEAALRTKLSPAQVQAALTQEQASELWAIVAAVRADLET
ncbi:MAG: hypothetical protein R3E79_38010 [Caldilineaceae bacterium]